ncbi:hypothetical protein llap_8683 [Limosa lapponica baueri]|uniref:Uncharacterized protein n=1 Tax=Limosa lapponica baueri TaxID=1758121 RepID=A0A2I0U4L6_LIMLA|nr:hypothetical protein llap_8683 [Limosa lapponica baueri]
MLLLSNSLQLSDLTFMSSKAIISTLTPQLQRQLFGLQKFVTGLHCTSVISKSMTIWLCILRTVVYLAMHPQDQLYRSLSNPEASTRCQMKVVMDDRRQHEI